MSAQTLGAEFLQSSSVPAVLSVTCLCELWRQPSSVSSQCACSAPAPGQASPVPVLFPGHVPRVALPSSPCQKEAPSCLLFGEPRGCNEQQETRVVKKLLYRLAPSFVTQGLKNGSANKKLSVAYTQSLNWTQMHCPESRRLKGVWVVDLVKMPGSLACWRTERGWRTQGGSVRRTHGNGPRPCVTSVGIRKRQHFIPADAGLCRCMAWTWGVSWDVPAAGRAAGCPGLPAPPLLHPTPGTTDLIWAWHCNSGRWAGNVQERKTLKQWK